MPKIKKKKIIQIKAKVISNKKIAPGYYKVLMKAPDIARMASPGQFVTIRVGEGYKPLLRRPFSIHRVKRKNIEILYKVVGQATEIFAEKNKGQNLDVLGPLGNGFDYKSTVPALPAGRHNVQQSTVLVAGGIGVAPLLFLAEVLITRLKVKGERLKVLIGARTKNEILCAKDFKGLGCEVEISTDDGSCGFKGKVTGLLKRMLSTIDHRPLTIYACGPKAMLGEIARIAKKYKITAQGSLEEHMACGIGVCMGCIIETQAGYRRVCYDGPVFDLNIIKW